MCELEKRASVDQLTHPALILLAARPEFFAQHGSVDASWRRRGAKTFGPYYRFRYRDGGDAHSLYLGIAGPVVDRVRQTLQTLQAPLRQRRALLQLRRQIRDSLRLDRRDVDARLRSFGLRLQGFEVRGWRTSPLHALAQLADPRRDPTSSVRIRPFQLPRTRLPRTQLPRTRLPRTRQLRFHPHDRRARGNLGSIRAAKWARENRPTIPLNPQARVAAALAARHRAASPPHPRR